MTMVARSQLNYFVTIRFERGVACWSQIRTRRWSVAWLPGAGRPRATPLQFQIKCPV